MTKRTIYDIVAPVVVREFVAKNTLRIVLSVGKIDIFPGQFVQLGVPGFFLRRPFSIAGYDIEKGELELLVQIVGKATTGLANLQIGSTVSVLLPLGNFFSETEIAVAGKKGEIWIVSGGIGIAPFLFLADRLAEKKNDFSVRSFVGFRSHDAFLQNAPKRLEKIGQVICEINRLITEPFLTALKTSRPELVLTCGPRPLLRALQTICLQYNLHCLASLEERMGCGIGACLVCNCEIKQQSGTEYKRVCKDGPIFELARVVL